MVEIVEASARSKSCAAAQVALAWVLAQGEDIVPIPGTKRRSYVEQNAAALDLRLTPAELQKLSDEIPAGSTAGARYPEPAMRAVNR